MMSTIVMLLALTSSFTFVSCTIEKRDVGDLCYLLWPNTAVIDNRLYFMSANFTFVASVGQNSTLMPYLYWLDLDSSFPAQENIPSSSLNTVRIDSTITGAMNAAMNDVGGYGNRLGALFYTNDTAYVYAGSPVEEADNVLAAYNTTSGIWSNVSVSGGDFNYGNRTSGASVSVLESSMSFYLGGESPHMPGLLRFNASEPASLAWTNETLGNGSYGVAVPDLSRLAMVYVPVGLEGVLIAFGGSNLSASGTQYAQSGLPNDSDMATIMVYDIHSHTWFSVTASGTVPSPRIQMCTAVTAAPDGSSFHITMYGGFSLAAGRSYEEVHVLSIPSFTWINITDQSSNSEAQLSRMAGRDSMSCDLYNGSQMTVLGGSIRAGASAISPAGQCNSTFPPVRVLDLTTYTWQRELNESLEYTVPAIIYNTIGGNSSGGDSNQVPSGGFGSSDLASIFQQRVAKSAATTATGGSSTAASAGSQTSATDTKSTAANDASSSSGHTATGAIAGGVVGGVAALAVAVGVAVYLYRKKNRKDVNPTGEDDSEMLARSYKQPYTGINHPIELHGNPRRPELDNEGQIHEMSSAQKYAELHSNDEIRELP